MAAPRVTEKERQFRSLLAECAESGLSMARFARARGIPAGTFAWGSAEIRRRDDLRRVERDQAGDAGGKGRLSFVPVRIVPEEVRPAPQVTRSGRIEVVLPGGAKVRIPAGAEQEAMVRVLCAVVATC